MTGLVNISLNAINRFHFINRIFILDIFDYKRQRNLMEFGDIIGIFYFMFACLPDTDLVIWTLSKHIQSI